MSFEHVSTATHCNQILWNATQGMVHCDALALLLFASRSLFLSPPSVTPPALSVHLFPPRQPCASLCNRLLFARAPQHSHQLSALRPLSPSFSCSPYTPILECLLSDPRVLPYLLKERVCCLLVLNSVTSIPSQQDMGVERRNPGHSEWAHRIANHPLCLSTPRLSVCREIDCQNLQQVVCLD